MNLLTSGVVKAEEPAGPYDFAEIQLARIRAAAPEEVIRCEECQRILVRNDESGL